MSTIIQADAAGAVTLPPELCRAAGVTPGADVAAEIQDGRIVIEPAAAAHLGAHRRIDRGCAAGRDRQIAARRRGRNRPVLVRHAQTRGVISTCRRTVFADTFYWVAVLNPHDPFHAVALSWGRNAGTVRLVTTDEVLTEALNWFSGAGPVLARQGGDQCSQRAERPQRGRAAAKPHRLRRRPRAVPGPARQRIQPDRLPVDGRVADVGRDRGPDQRSSFHAGRVHDPVSDALSGPPGRKQGRKADTVARGGSVGLTPPGADRHRPAQPPESVPGPGRTRRGPKGAAASATRHGAPRRTRARRRRRWAGRLGAGGGG